MVHGKRLCQRMINLNRLAWVLYRLFEQCLRKGIRIYLEIGSRSRERCDRFNGCLLLRLVCMLEFDVAEEEQADYDIQDGAYVRLRESTALQALNCLLEPGRLVDLPSIEVVHLDETSDAVRGCTSQDREAGISQAATIVLLR